MGRLRPLKIYINIYAIAALGLACFPESVAVLMLTPHAHPSCPPLLPTVRAARSLDRGRAPAADFRPKHFLIYR